MQHHPKKIESHKRSWFTNHRLILFAKSLFSWFVCCNKIKSKKYFGAAFSFLYCVWSATHQLCFQTNFFLFFFYFFMFFGVLLLLFQYVFFKIFFTLFINRNVKQTNMFMVFIEKNWKLKSLLWFWNSLMCTTYQFFLNKTK